MAAVVGIGVGGLEEQGVAVVAVVALCIISNIILLYSLYNIPR